MSACQGVGASALVDGELVRCPVCRQHFAPVGLTRAGFGAGTTEGAVPHHEAAVELPIGMFRFPVMASGTLAAGSVPRWVAEVAHRAYVRRGSVQPLEVVGRRGGFCWAELGQLLAEELEVAGGTLGGVAFVRMEGEGRVVQSQADDEDGQAAEVAP